jgi:D-alanine-D-alanine ligase
MKVAVIQGGASAEAEVSRRSAAGVAAALKKAGHAPECLELGALLASSLVQRQFEVVFPATHGRFGEDGCLQGLLEIVGVPYVGSGVLASALGMSKIAAKRMFAAADLPLAPQYVVNAGCDLDRTARELREQLGPAVVIKPSSQGSAIGVTRVAGEAGQDVLVKALQDTLAYDDVVLCEKFAPGREITCGIVDLAPEGLRALPVTEIFSKAADWYDFASRYAAGGSVHQCPASLPAEVAARVQQYACAAHAALGCRDLSRVDFVVGDTITLLEVNTIPGMTATSLYPEAAAAAGIPFDQLCDRLVRQAAQRAQGKRELAAVPIP